MSSLGHRTTLSLVVAVVAAAGACGDDPATPAFPADYAATYVEVRDCRASADHDLNRVRVLADPGAADAYLLRDRPFPTGSIILKEEFDFGDMDCTGDVVQWTVMEQLPTGSAPDTLDWRWQKVTAAGKVASEDDQRCIGCHDVCGVAPDGYLGTCAIP